MVFPSPFHSTSFLCPNVIATTSTTETTYTNPLPSLGWWLAKKLTTPAQGWVPSAYLVEAPQTPAPIARSVPPPPPPTSSSTPSSTPKPATTNGTAPTPRAKPTPPAPPKRPGGRKPAAPAPAPRDSAVSMSAGDVGKGGTNGEVAGKGNGVGVGQPSLAGGLAEALRMRQQSMQGGRKGEDDDEW